jgi:hypothetical protein
MNDTQKKPNKDNECLSEITENQEDTLNEMNNSSSFDKLRPVFNMNRNDRLEEFEIKEDDVLHKYFAVGMLYFSPNNVVKRAFLVRGMGRNRTKRNRKNRKGTRRLKRRQ